MSTPTDSNSHRASLFFVPYGQKTNVKLRRDANRHVQLRRNTLHASTARLSVPVQIRFRVSVTQTATNTILGEDDYGKITEQLDPRSTIRVPRLLSDDIGSDNDRHGAQYFNEVIAIELTHEITNQFWEVYIPQRARQEPVLRHALTTLSYVYRQRCECSSDTIATLAQMPSIVRIVSRVLAELRVYMQSPQAMHGTVIVCAIILASIHAILGESQAADVHMNNSLAIFMTWTQSGDVAQSADYHSLHTHLMRFDTSATARDLTRMPMLPTMQGQSAPTFRETLQFDRVEQMHDYLTLNVGHSLLAHSSRQGLHGPASSSVNVLVDIERRLSRFSVAVGDFKEASSTLSLKDELGLVLVEAHYLTCVCKLAEESQQDVTVPAMAWDYHLESIMQLGQQAIAIRRNMRQAEPAGKTRDGPRRSESGVRLNKTIGENFFLIFAHKVSTEQGRARVRELVRQYQTV